MKTITRSIRIREDLNKLLNKQGINVSKECEKALEDKVKELEKKCPTCNRPLEAK